MPNASAQPLGEGYTLRRSSLSFGHLYPYLPNYSLKPRLYLFHNRLRITYYFMFVNSFLTKSLLFVHITIAFILNSRQIREQILMEPDKIIIGHRGNIIADDGIGIGFPVREISFIK